MFLTVIMSGGGGGHTSISLTGMVIQEQISTAQNNTMTLNSNPKNRMTQDAIKHEN